MAEIRWLGHTCFRIKGKEATVIVDPVERSTGFGIGKNSADIVTFSGDPLGKNLGAMRPEFRVIDGPGEYEMHNVFVTGVRTHQDNQKGAVNGHNTAYIIELEGLKIGHLGNIGHTLTEAQAEPLEELDILLAPAGGTARLTYDQAVELVTQLSPKLVVPMLYATPIGDSDLGSLADFVKKLGVEQHEALDKLTIRTSDLTETMQIAILNPDSEPVKR